MAAITDLPSVKTFMGITDASDDGFLELILPAVDAAIKKFLDRDVNSATYTEYYHGNNSVVLVLNEYPVTNVASVYVDNTAYWGSVSGSFASTGLLTSGTDYALVLDGRGAEASTGRLVRIGAVWTPRFEVRRGNLTAALKAGLGNIKVTYTAGYANVPQDLKLAFWMVCAQIRYARERGLLPQSESLSEYSYSLGPYLQDVLQVGTIAQLLSRYKRIRERYRVLG